MRFTVKLLNSDNSDLASEESKALSTTKTLQARHVRAREITCLRALSKKIGVHLKQTEVMSRPERKAHNSHVSRGKQATEEVNTGNKELKQTEEDEEDPFDTRIKKSGCADLHYALLVSKALRTYLKLEGYPVTSLFRYRYQVISFQISLILLFCWNDKTVQ